MGAPEPLSPSVVFCVFLGTENAPLNSVCHFQHQMAPFLYLCVKSSLLLCSATSCYICSAFSIQLLQKLLSINEDQLA